MKYEVALNIEGLKKEVKKTTVSNTKIGAVNLMYSWIRWESPDILGDVFFSKLPNSFFNLTADKKIKAMEDSLNDNNFTKTTIVVTKAK